MSRRHDDVIVNFGLNREERDAIDHEAKRLQISRSQLIRRAINSWLIDNDADMVLLEGREIGGIPVWRQKPQNNRKKANVGS